jgi:hypothetical protein
VCLIPFLLIRATDGRDFAGFYSVSNVIDLGESVPVRLILNARITNYSDADVENATVTISGNVNPVEYGAFTGISVADRGNVELSRELIIPREEYTFWLSGGAPALWIAYRDSSDDDALRRVELTVEAGREE